MIVLLFTQCTFNETDAAPCEWVCGISGNHGPRMRQCLRKCHRNENAARHQSHTLTRLKQADFTAIRTCVWRAGDGLGGPFDRSRVVLCIRVISVVGRVTRVIVISAVAAACAWCCGSQQGETAYDYNRRCHTSRSTSAFASRSSDVVSCVNDRHRTPHENFGGDWLRGGGWANTQFVPPVYIFIFC